MITSSLRVDKKYLYPLHVHRFARHQYPYVSWLDVEEMLWKEKKRYSFVIENRMNFNPSSL